MKHFLIVNNWGLIEAICGSRQSLCDGARTCSAPPLLATMTAGLCGDRVARNVDSRKQFHLGDLLTQRFVRLPWLGFYLPSKYLSRIHFGCQTSRRRLLLSYWGSFGSGFATLSGYGSPSRLRHDSIKTCILSRSA